MKRFLEFLIFFLTLLLLFSNASAQSANVGKSRIKVDGSSATVVMVLTVKAATALLADRVPSRESSEVEANGEVLVVEYSEETRAYVVEESTFSRIADVRRYVREWLREVLEV